MAMRYREVAAVVREANRRERRGTLQWAAYIRERGVTVGDYARYARIGTFRLLVAMVAVVAAVWCVADWLVAYYAGK